MRRGQRANDDLKNQPWASTTATPALSTAAQHHPAPDPPPGAPHPPLHEAEQEPVSLLSRALDAGCSLLQGLGPVKQIHQHVEAFHMYAHDATRPCVLYDSAEPGARLIGIEYIISRRMFESLPEEERRFWHSHVYEVKSGMLVAPGVPGPAEDADMGKVNRDDALPLGPPQLMMVFTADGQLPARLVAARDKEVGSGSAQVRRRRAHLAADPPQPHPDADHLWRTGRAWQCVMQQVDFKAAVPEAPQPAEQEHALARGMQW
ncbi:hypothetical protein HXX76_004263 [Chlamydomonas incerta]|uniref:DUF1264-domain-containing protein n=1 Tax=Chlamydomonas incerta TaxID=51695 RepID=A0A835TLZ0_CHLIN|nr:hypothetical protein HXX76_004263 [Chlamydomonas incerta]|eukprot:KAG2440150.1 hypothetical protein HXX76_004263 [Chlamydomonas incerta]